MMEGTHSRLNIIKERISESKGKIEEFTQHITHRDKRGKMCVWGGGGSETELNKHWY